MSVQTPNFKTFKPLISVRYSDDPTICTQQQNAFQFYKRVFANRTKPKFEQYKRKEKRAK